MKTLRIPVSQATPEMTVADSVYTFNNQLIISEGTRLTDKIITRLKFYSIDQIRIRIDEKKEEPVSQAPVKKESYYKKLKTSDEFKNFSNQVISISDHLQTTMQDMLNGRKNVDISALYEEVNKVVANSQNGLHIFDMLHCMRGYDDHTYIHSVNVALICKVLGTWLHFTMRDTETVTLCGLLHDIGKMTIPYDIISKPSKLTADEYSTVKAHALRGYNILRPLDINIHIKMSAMMHHERCDGSGYPMGLTGDQIDKFAKVVMIADVYDAMTCARVYRGPLCAFEAIAVFENEGLTKYDPKFIMTFFDHITQLYLHSIVRLNNDETGEIVIMNRNMLSRPVIQVGDEFIDLAQNHNLHIVEVL